jgi:hypothetical protein
MVDNVVVGICYQKLNAVQYAAAARSFGELMQD